MTIRNRWLNFVYSTADKMEQDDPQGALQFRLFHVQHIPPDEETLEWGIAYITTQQALMELMSIYEKYGRLEEALVLSSFMAELNSALSTLQSKYETTNEFVKESKF